MPADSFRAMGSDASVVVVGGPPDLTARARTRIDELESLWSRFLPDSEGAAGVTEGWLCGVRVTRAAQGGKGPRLTARQTRSARTDPCRPGGPAVTPRALLA